MMECKLCSYPFSYPPLPSHLSPQTGLHRTCSYQMGVHVLVYLSVRSANEKKDCESTHDTNIWPLSSKPFGFSLNSFPPQRWSWSLCSFRLMTGCSSFLNSLFELSNASFPITLRCEILEVLASGFKSSLQIATLMTSESLLTHF